MSEDRTLGDAIIELADRMRTPESLTWWDTADASARIAVVPGNDMLHRDRYPQRSSPRLQALDLGSFAEFIDQFDGGVAWDALSGNFTGLAWTADVKDPNAPRATCPWPWTFLATRWGINAIPAAQHALVRSLKAQELYQLLLDQAAAGEPVASHEAWLGKLSNLRTMQRDGMEERIDESGQVVMRSVTRGTECSESLPTELVVNVVILRDAHGHDVSLPLRFAVRPKVAESGKGLIVDLFDHEAGHKRAHVLAKVTRDTGAPTGREAFFGTLDFATWNAKQAPEWAAKG